VTKESASNTISVDNTAYASDYRGGLAFATDSGFVSQVSPTAVSVVDNGATASLTFTFPSNSFPGTAYLRGPWGQNPFNRDNNSTIEGLNPSTESMKTKASMLREAWSGEVSIPIQPYYNGASGPDYFSAS
jgi:hypothetical protein